MPVYKALILNKEISVNYDEHQKEKLVEAIKEINSKLESYDNQNGKIIDSKLLSFLAIQLQADLLDLKEKKDGEVSFGKKFEDSNTENISLNKKIYKLREQNEKLKNENDLINIELIKIQSQIDVIVNLVKKTYED